MLVICASRRHARRRSCCGGYRNVIGCFGIPRPLNTYIHNIYDILGTVLSISPAIPIRVPAQRFRSFLPDVGAHAQRYVGVTVLYFPSRDRICALQHAGPGEEYYGHGARPGDRINSL